MEIGIDSFGGIGLQNKTSVERSNFLNNMIDRIVAADQAGLDVFGVGEHYRKDFVDSATAVILGAAASRTKNIRLNSAVTVLSTADPVRVFQNFATLDLISRGRAEIIVGRGSFIESYPLFGYKLEDYDELFAEKLGLLLKIRDNEKVSWTGKFRADMDDQGVYPRPIQNPLPIWLGVGGTPASFKRAGTLGLPLAVAVIGGETHRFRPLVEMYRQAWEAAGHPPEEARVSLHSLGFVAEDSKEAIESYYPGYVEAFSRIGKERGWPPITRGQFDSMTGPSGALVIGNPEEVAEKISRHSEALGGISRFTFQMDNTGLTQEQVLKAIELIGGHISPAINKN